MKRGHATLFLDSEIREGRNLSRLIRPPDELRLMQKID